MATSKRLRFVNFTVFSKK